MTRQFLTSTEFAIFMQGREEKGVYSATVYGPCPDALTAWNIATYGCDADHLESVIRCDTETGTFENVTSDVAAVLEANAIRTDDVRGLPRFVDRDELEIAMGREDSDNSYSTLDARILGVGDYR